MRARDQIKVGRWAADLRDRLAIAITTRFCTQPLRRIRRRLPAYVFGDLAPEDCKAIEDHIDQCYRCGVELEQARRLRAGVLELSAAYRTALERGTLPESPEMRALLAEALLDEKIRSRRERSGPALCPRRALPFGLPARTLGLSALVLAAVVAGAFWVGFRDTRFSRSKRPPVDESLLRQTSVELASRAVQQEPMVDLRTSLGPEIPVIALLLQPTHAKSLSEEDSDLAEDLLRSGAFQSSQDPRTLAAAGLLLAFDRKGEKARPLLDRSLALVPPGDSATLLDAGVIALLLCDFSLAESCFTRSLRADPGSCKARYDLARLFEITERPQAASKAWREYAELDSASLWAELAGAHLFETPDPAEARQKHWPPWK